jgi:triacylglycerol lipase
MAPLTDSFDWLTSLASSSDGLPAMNDLRITTKYPILLIHGLFGSDRIGAFDIFHSIVPALENAGCRVYVPVLSGVFENEARGEQLLDQIERFMKRTGYLKANLIGHGQGALTARYAAAIRPDRVASVTSVCGPNHGSEAIDALALAMTPGELPEPRSIQMLADYDRLLRLINPESRGSGASLYLLKELSTYTVARFNRRYPQGLPAEWGGEGAEQVNGVNYYSWSGCLQGTLPDEGQNAFDPLHLALRSHARLFERETEHNDGLVGRYSSHLGKVIRSDYPLDHVDAINQTAGWVRSDIDPVQLYVDHAGLLFCKGL